MVLKDKRIVLMHGWGASTEKLIPFTKELKGLGWRVFLPKLPGFDKSPPKKVWGVGDYAEYVLSQTKRKFGSKGFFVFGHSFGGRIAIKIAAQSPRNLKGVVLCSAGGLSRGYKLVRLFFFILAKIGKVFLLFPPLAFFWRKVLYKLAGEHDYEKAKGIMKEVLKKVIAEDIRPVIFKIKLPTLILWGNLDTVTPVKDAYFIEKAQPKSKLIIFNNQGHRIPYIKPAEVAKEIEKWAKSLN